MYVHVLCVHVCVCVCVRACVSVHACECVCTFSYTCEVHVIMFWAENSIKVYVRMYVHVGFSDVPSQQVSEFCVYLPKHTYKHTYICVHKFLCYLPVHLFHKNFVKYFRCVCGTLVVVAESKTMHHLYQLVLYAVPGGITMSLCFMKFNIYSVCRSAAIFKGLSTRHTIYLQIYIVQWLPMYI